MIIKDDFLQFSIKTYFVGTHSNRLTEAILMWVLISVPTLESPVYFICKQQRCRSAHAFESYLVENPEDRFSRDMAHMFSWRNINITPKLPSVTHRLPTSSVFLLKRRSGALSLFVINTCLDMSRDMTKPAKWVCAQQRLSSAWASAQSDQSIRWALNG